MIINENNQTKPPKITKTDLASDGTLFGDQNKFQKLIQGEGESKTIYIKVTYNKDATQGGNGQFFGLKNLKIVGELKLK